MRVGLFTREYPPQVYGGAGVHVDYLSRELAKEIEVEVHCWGPQHSDHGKLHVRGAEPWAEISNGTEGKFKGALEAFSLNLTQVKALQGIDVVHTHTWYVSMAGYLAKKLYGMPFVLTTHSLEPLRAWKSEQLGSGYAMSSWMERTAILDADAIIAVSQGTKADILRAYPDVGPGPHPRHLQRHRSGRIPEDRRKLRRLSITESIPACPMFCLSAASRARKALRTWSTPSATCRRKRRLCSAPERPTRRRLPPSCATRSKRRAAIIPALCGLKRWSRSRRRSSSIACRVFCCPSVYEPFGIINLEAMACRAPVVASATGGIKEVVVDGETGYLVPFDQDPVTSFPLHPERFARDLAVRLHHLLQDPEKCRRFGDAGRRRVEEIFSWTAIAHQTISLYERLIDKSKAGGQHSGEV